MGDPESFPKYLVIATANGEDLVWRMQRASDLALCAAEHGVPVDGEILVHRPVVREWSNCADATAWTEVMEDDAASAAAELWVPAPSFLDPPAGPHIDPPPGSPFPFY